MVRPILPKEERPESPRTDDGLNAAKANKRRCISSACLPCRRRKSKCDGASPSCSTCAAVYRMECVYDQDSDRRRRSTLRRDMEVLQTKKNSLEALIQQIRSAPDNHVGSLVDHLRAHASLEEMPPLPPNPTPAPLAANPTPPQTSAPPPPPEEMVRKRKRGESRVGMGQAAAAADDGRIAQDVGFLEVDCGGGVLRHFGVQNVIGFVHGNRSAGSRASVEPVKWTDVTKDPGFMNELLHYYFTCQHPVHMFLHEQHFRHDFEHLQTQYCSRALVNAMMALACHHCRRPEALGMVHDAESSGDHFFAEAKAHLETEELRPSVTACQALGIMSLRELGCGRDQSGWMYSGRAFRLATDLGIHLPSHGFSIDSRHSVDIIQENVRQITFWGLFFLDKFWSMHLGRVPVFPMHNVACPRPVVATPEEEAVIRQSGFRPGITAYDAYCDVAACLGEVLTQTHSPGEQNTTTRTTDALRYIDKLKSTLPAMLRPSATASPIILLLQFFPLHPHRTAAAADGNSMFFEASTILTASPLNLRQSPPDMSTLILTSATSFCRLLSCLPPTFTPVLLVPLILTVVRFLLPIAAASAEMAMCLNTLQAISPTWPLAAHALAAFNSNRPCSASTESPELKLESMSAAPYEEVDLFSSFVNVEEPGGDMAWMQEWSANVTWDCAKDGMPEIGDVGGFGEEGMAFLDGMELGV